VGSEYRKPSASADEQYQYTPGVSFPIGAAKQQGTPPGNERIEEPSYQEHGVNPSGQKPVEDPSFYPADLPDRQLQEERWQAPLAQPQQKNGAYPYNQGQQAYQALPPVPVSLPPQGPVPYTPNPQYPPYVPRREGFYTPPSPPVAYTDPRVYQQPTNGYAQQPQPPRYPGYPGYPSYPGYPYQGYYMPYGYQQSGYVNYPGYPPPGYPVYPYAWYPPRPRRNGYQLGIAITSLVGSILAVIAGVFCGIALLLIFSTTNTGLGASKIFASGILYTALMLAGIVGGAFGILHSSFALALRPSRPFKLPPFWSFLLLYVIILTVGFLVGSSDVVLNNLLLAFPLVALSGLLPALTFLAFALWRLCRPETREWPTTWRRFTLALVSGATSAILLALIFEGLLSLIAAIDNPHALTARDPGQVIFTLMIVSVIAPIVEEGFKPLAVITMIGRIRSAAEAFILGMACGIGFDLVETTSYMGIGYNNWINVAVDRSTAGLLHGFGAGMMALGWYYITHKDALKRNHIQIGLGCMLYAFLQHAIWNGSFVLQLLPDPIGPYLETGKIPLFGYQLDAFLIVYMIFSVFMLCFLWFVTGKIRLQSDADRGKPNAYENKDKSGNPAPMKVAPVS